MNPRPAQVQVMHLIFYTSFFFSLYAKTAPIPIIVSIKKSQKKNFKIKVGMDS